MAHHSTTVWYRFKLPFETVVLPFETVVLLFQNGTTSCLKQDWSCFETEVLPFRYRDCTLARYLYYRSGSTMPTINLIPDSYLGGQIVQKTCFTFDATIPNIVTMMPQS